MNEWEQKEITWEENLIMLAFCESISVKIHNGIILLWGGTLVLLAISLFGFSKYACNYPDTPLRISEICLHNKTVAFDENGEYGTDFVELFNSSDKTLNLAGYGLSDNMDEPYRYTFPSIVLNPGESILFWGRKNPDDISLYRYEYICHYIGFSFHSGEICMLTDPEGRLIEKLSLPEVPTDLSYQITSDNMNNFIIGKPTVGFIGNTSDVSDAYTFSDVSSPVFSTESGFYSSPFELEISATEGCLIYYSLDSSVPTEQSLVYSGPIIISDRNNLQNVYSIIDDISIWNTYLPKEAVDKGTVVRAVAVNEAGQFSDVVTAFFYVGSMGVYSGLPVMSIISSPNNLFSDSDGIYVLGEVYRNYIQKYKVLPTKAVSMYETNFSKRGKGWERDAEIFYFGGNQELLCQQRVGLRIHGLSSAAFNQKGLGLFANSKENTHDVIDYDFFDDGHFYDEIILKGGDVYQTKMREALITRLFDESEHMGLQKTQLCNVFLDGEYWGVYNIQEKISESYIENRYGIPYEDVIYIKNDEINTKENQYYQLWSNLIDFVTTEDMSDSKNYSSVTDMMDVQSYIDFICIEMYTGNCDIGDMRNAAVFRSREKSKGPFNDGRWRWLHVDMDGNTNILKEHDCSYDDIKQGMKRFPMFACLLNNDEFRKQFIHSFMKYSSNEFEYNRVHLILEKMADEYREPVVNSQQRWRGDFVIAGMTDENSFNGNYSEEDFNYNIEIMDNFFRDRSKYIIEYLKNDICAMND